MSVVGFPEDSVGYPPRRRCGGYYPTLEAAEAAADFLAYDVVIPPRCQFGFYLVPAPQPTEERGNDGPSQ